MFGPCKCCAILKDEISFLRSIVRPEETKHDPLPRVTFEADQIISGADAQILIEQQEHEDKRQAEIDSEAAKLLAGTY